MGRRLLAVCEVCLVKVRKIGVRVTRAQAGRVGETI